MASELKRHEKVSRKRVRELREDISKRGVLKPILVDSSSFAVLDGHHRLEALKELKAFFVPVFLVHYPSKKIKVKQRRKEIPVSKGIVVRKALSGKLFPRKTTKHVLSFEIKEDPTDLSELREAKGF
jgi:hypothetical protein